MTVTRRDEVEDIIIQALGHSERRNIIDVLGTSTEGVPYSEILGEIGLNTGKMNYHLKLLEGVIERDKNRLYILTPLGRKAFIILNSMTEDLENGYEEYLGKARLSRSTGVLKTINVTFVLLALTSVSVVAAAWVFIDSEIAAGRMPPSSMSYVYGATLIALLGLFIVRSWVSKRADKSQELIDRIIGRLNRR